MVKRMVQRSKPSLGGVALLFLISAACSPADRQFGTGGAGGGGGASSASSSASASSSTSASSSATSSSSAGAGGSGGAGCSDADMDGFTSIACGGKDCADNDVLVYPGELKWYTTPSNGTKSFDYNCDGIEEIQFTGILKCTLPNCDTNSKNWASITPPNCGVTVDYGACQIMGFMCVPVVLGKRVQGCR